ncbi:MAG: methylmalonyl Co-A mutase-associated GTPase MeaB [Anaerolineales bacterium]|jgi:LAO/AO transport system kinase
MKSVERVLKGDRLALARLLTQIENEEPDGLEALSALYPHTGHAHRIGITGAPGTGKSSLVNRLALHLRHNGWSGKGEAEAKTVAIVAVDPSSPFSGGAFLGDRIRMRDLYGDPGIFIRSMASRGALGGLALATVDMVEALDAAGFDAIIIETVGAGQAEVDIARMAHTVVVVDAPGLGDDVQAIKAGILEIADILVVNKADLPGAENTLRALKLVLELANTSQRSNPKTTTAEAENGPVWLPPVLPTVAIQGDGVAELAQAIHKHREHLDLSGEYAARERARVRSEMEDLLRHQLLAGFLDRQKQGGFESALEAVLAKKKAPRQAVRELIEGQSR